MLPGLPKVRVLAGKHGANRARTPPEERSFPAGPIPFLSSRSQPAPIPIPGSIENLVSLPRRLQKKKKRKAALRAFPDALPQ